MVLIFLEISRFYTRPVTRRERIAGREREKKHLRQVSESAESICNALIE